LLGIINDILDFSKIEAGKMAMEAVDFNLDDVLDNLANLITVKAQEKEDLEILFATARDVPRYLVGDPLRLGQILINLANNAVKFTESGEIVVSSELVKQDQDQVTLKMSVSDTGIGLTRQQISRLFQNSEALQALNGASILLVENNEINQQVAEEILSAAGFKVSIANNGLEAVNAVKEKDYDAVLMDVQMPVMDGYTAAKEIREWESVSANADSDIWETEARGQGDRSQRTEVRIQASNLKAENRGQKSDDRFRNTNSAFRIPNSKAFQSSP
jgi:CheY-like chemotaxis protein